jgi:NAD(P)-dependent dehydrogenase (short-subunit alcohol dehydrogenase family)
MPLLPEYSLAGKVAILHTAGGDQAPFLAQALAEAGATVFTVARRQDLLEPVLKALEQYPGGHGGTAAEIGGHDPSQLARAMESFDQQHSQVDILVNDVRSMLARPFTEISPEQWDELQSRNVRATFLLCQEAGRRMELQQYGRIVNLVSILAERGMINGSAFAASQAAVLSLTRSLAVELGRSNIRVNALGTGWYTSEEVPLEEQQEELLVRFTPLRRKGHPRDIGPLLVYLSSEACDYVSGQPIYVDGGLNAHP